MKNNSVGVIVGRFQVPKLHSGHIEIINRVLQNHKKLLLVLGCKYGNPDLKNPLPYITRDTMIREMFPMATIIPFFDMKDDKEWVKNLDRVVEHLYPHEDITFYGSRDSFLNCYESNGGKWNTQVLEPLPDFSGTLYREQISGEVLNTEDFRKGIIYSVYNRYPIVYQTVDIIPFSDDYVLLGKKKEEKLFRFIGGFVDPKDPTLEHAALRELDEEAGMVSTYESDFKYLGSTKIKDIRYTNPDTIMTSVFVLNRTNEQLSNCAANDDLDSLEIIKIKDLNASMIEDAHIPIMNMFLIFLGIMETDPDYDNWYS